MSKTLGITYIQVLAAALLGACQATAGAGTPGSSGPGTTTVDGGSAIGPERCNGLDDDRDGTVDEDCACEAGGTQACWPGEPSQSGVGQCRNGTQACGASAGEFSSWGPCEGAVLPSEEIFGNCIDEDCNGDMPGCMDPCGEFELCGNGLDDDCNGRADCDDAACDCPRTCVEGEAGCVCEEWCSPGLERYCDEPRYCNWGKQTCGPDGRWGACTETSDVPPDCDDALPIPLPIDLGVSYDPECCVRAGLCCQNYGYDGSLPSDASVGNCAGIADRVCAPI